jgi:hypothetical protein
LSTPALLTHNIEKGKFDLRNPSDVFWFNAKKREQMMGIRAKKWFNAKKREQMMGIRAKKMDDRGFRKND